jgi:hypothetical protein
MRLIIDTTIEGLWQGSGISLHIIGRDHKYNKKLRPIVSSMQADVVIFHLDAFTRSLLMLTMIMHPSITVSAGSPNSMCWTRKVIDQFIFTPTQDWNSIT